MTLARSPLSPKLRSRKCICGSTFLQSRMGQQVCSPKCAYDLVAANKAKAERKADRAKKHALKTRQQWLQEAQTAFNAFIRARDADLPCISCGRFHPGSYDAGHYRSVGAQPALRFDETNVHKQCVPCNQFKGGNVIEYRLRLLQKIGPEAVAFLETEHEPAKYTIEDAQRIKARYKGKLAALKN